MVMPLGIWLCMLVGAVLSTIYFLRVDDKDNNSDLIAGALGLILWLASGYQIWNGVVVDNVSYTISWFGWIPISIGIILALLLFSEILNAVNDDGLHDSRYGRQKNNISDRDLFIGNNDFDSNKKRRF